MTEATPPEPKTFNVYAFDVETNGLLDKLTKIHCLVVKDVLTGKVWSFSDNLVLPPYNMEDSIESGLDLLSQADVFVGHNVIQFDLHAIKKVYPKWTYKARVVDTIVLARLVFPDLKNTDFTIAAERKKAGKQFIPPRMYGRHTLDSWGQRLGVWKGDYGQKKEEEGKALGLKGDELVEYVWGTWSQEMQDYCVQDVEVTVRLYGFLRSKLISWGLDPDQPIWKLDCVDTELRVAEIIDRQMKYGFAVDERKIDELFGILSQEMHEIDKKLRSVFRPWYRPVKSMTVASTRRMKRTDLPMIKVEKFTPSGKPKGIVDDYVTELYEEGATYTKVELTEFNPKSRDHCIDRLKVMYGWEPQEFTDDGNAKLDDEVLSELPYAEAPLLAHYYMLSKRIGQVATGKEAWKRHIRNGRIHGSVISIGTPTSRMTHSKPNIAQVPGLMNKKTGEPMAFGKECRECFIVGVGKVMVGCDADALELRDLAGYMARYDGGDYIRTVLEGKKELKTDMHSRNAGAIGTTRDIAKVWFYAFIYGAGDYKLGLILGCTGTTKETQSAGLKSRNKFAKNLPALGALIDKVKEKAKSKFIKGIDGRMVPVRKLSAALNTLLQSAGAIQMKKALVILDDNLQAAGFIPGVHYEFVANVHDEWQIEVDEAIAKEVGRLAEEAIKLAGEFFKFRCPLAGNAGYGHNWAETH